MDNERTSLIKTLDEDDNVQQRFSVPPGPVVAASASVDWLRPVLGASTLSWWQVTVWTAKHFAPGVPVKRRVYELKALDDNMAAERGLRRFEREYAQGLI